MAKKLYKSLNYVTKITVNGKVFRTLKLYGTLCKISEPWLGEILKLIFKMKPGTFIDIGMNIGQTLLEVKSIDPDRHYVGFEPNPSCNMYVEELVRINKLKKCTLVPVGLYTEDALLNLDLYYDDLTNSGGSIIPDYWKFNNTYHIYRSIYVPVFTFKTISRSIGVREFDILKIDVEGAEFGVLTTLSDEIAKSKPFIIIEILSAYSEENTLRFDSQKKIQEFVTKHDYLIFRIIENSKLGLQRLMKIEEFDVKFNPNMCNYIFVHKSEESLFTETFSAYFKV